MNAITGHGFIFALVAMSIENHTSKAVVCFMAVLFGALGIAREIADRIKREKGVPNGNDISGPSR
jgi:hypothetical protein